MNAPEPVPFKAEGPQPLIRDLPEGEPYPVDALGDLAPAVRAVQGATQAPIAIPAASALAVASLAVQGFANVETLGGVSPTSLFLLTIAASGERKSGCDKAMTRGLREHEFAEAEKHAKEVRRFDDAHALWKSERDAIVRAAGSAKGEKRTAVQADLEGLADEPKRPPSPDRTSTEPTFEGLTKMLQTGQPSLGVFSAEGAQFLGGHAMNRDNRQKTLAAFNLLWDGEPIRRTRAGDGAFTLWGRRVAAHLLVQPGPAHGFMADPLAGDTGFLARFLISEPPSTIGARFSRNERRADGDLTRFAFHLRSVLERKMECDFHTGALKPRTLALSNDARALLVKLSDSVEAAQAPGGDFEGIRATASKAAEQAARIAGVLTLWRDLGAGEITGAVMADAITLAGWYLGEAARLAGAAEVSAEVEWAEKLRKWLLEIWEHPEILVRDVVRLAPIRALRESPKARAAIDMLAKHGWLAPIEPGAVIRGAARKEAWRIVRGGGDAV